MILTIWRHGAAGSAATDRQRELTSIGRDDVGFGCHRFFEHCSTRDLPHPDLILYSEWLRTTETADIIAGAVSLAALLGSSALIPGSSVAAVDARLEPLFAAGISPAHLVLVSHQPLVSALVDYFLGDRGLVEPLSPGGLACLQLDVAAAGCASLVFSAQPPQYEMIR